MEDYIVKFDKAIEHYQEQLASLRTSRANPAVLENIPVDSYGSKMPLRQLATINTPEPQQLTVQPWDINIINEVSKAIQSSPLGLQPQIEGNLIRISLPPLTEERRKELIKVLSQYEESARISIKKIREETIRGWKLSQKDGDISEDDLSLKEKDIQKIVDQKHDQLKQFNSDKEKEIMTV